MHYLIYKTTNLVNGKYYIGAHRTENKNDSYLGSGVALRKAIQKHGIENFSREIIEECDSQDSMFDRERELISEVLADPLSYNMREGGKGGWDHVDSSGDNNGMRDPGVAKRNAEAVARTKAKDPEKYRRVSMGNLEKAKQSAWNNGAPRPDEFKAKIGGISKEVWKDPEYRKKVSDSLSSWYKVTTPEGVVFETNRLTEFCEEHNIPFSSVCRDRGDKPIAQGKAKGWKCQKITQK